MKESIAERIRQSIREVPDFPKQGINFYDITTVLKNGPLFRDIVCDFAERYKAQSVDAVVGIESRGFIFGAALAYELGTPFVPVRKPGKLPAETLRVSYSLEYGEDSVEIHKDALGRGQRVVLIDDLLATGGTAQATAELVSSSGAQVIELGVVVELTFLDGRDKLSPVPVHALIGFDH